MAGTRDLLSLLGDIDGTLSLLTIVAGFGLYMRPKLIAWYAARKRATLEAQIKQLEVLSTSPSARSELMQQRTLWVFVALGMWVMLQALSILPDGAKFVVVAHWLCGGIVYLIATDTLGKMRQIKDAPTTLRRLRQQLAALQLPTP
jgi:hypothetical protein